VFGVGPAIIAGDALHTLAHQLLLEVPGPPGGAAAEALARATGGMIAGQADDLAFETGEEVSVEACLAMEAAKTGDILACASAIGAILADAPAATVDALHDYGLHLGQSFQAVDDILGIWGDPARTGKPVASDLRQHKKTLPVVAALAREPAGELASLLGAPEPTEAQLARAVELLEAAGAKDLAHQEATRHLDVALGALERTALDDAAAAQLADLARFVTDREA
jgi:geranylgeranyl diphosphate synthase type I